MDLETVQNNVVAKLPLLKQGDYEMWRLIIELQKIVSQLAILGENISQEDLNLKFLRILSSEWNTHVVVWRNKPYLNSMSFDDLYNNFKIVEQEVSHRLVPSLFSSLLANNLFLSFIISTSSLAFSTLENFPLSSV
ncbi:hypothetical protein Tco_1212170 [Tanacetum coccineum]